MRMKTHLSAIVISFQYYLSKLDNKLLRILIDTQYLHI